MDPQPSGSKRKSTSSETETVITAEFTVPSGECGSKDGVKVLPINGQRNSYPSPKSFSGADQRDKWGSKKVGNSKSSPIFIRLDFNESTWKLDIGHNWIYRLSQLTPHPNLIRGSVHFRNKLFGKWEPIDFLSHFAEESDGKLQSSGARVVLSTFPVSLLDTKLPEFTLEMTLTLEHIFTSDEEEILRSKQSAEKKNKSRRTSLKPDFFLKVDDEEFFAHRKQINAFSNELKATLKRKGGSSYDMSDFMTTKSIQALLRFIYYEKFDANNGQEEIVYLLKFSHKYKETSLFKICEKKLMRVRREHYDLKAAFEMYMLCRAPMEFEKLKKYFGRILSRKSRGLGANEFKILAEKHECGLGEELLKEIKQFTRDPKDYKSVKGNMGGLGSVCRKYNPLLKKCGHYGDCSDLD